MKKVKGFTLVELIVVVAIFGMIMVAALSVLQPVGNVYMSTANYEHARASSDNVRLFVEDSLRYANRMKVVSNSSLADATSEAVNMIVGFQESDGTNRIATNEDPLYIMEINNDLNANNQMGYITVYKYTNGTAMTSSVFKTINESLYGSPYGYKFRICSNPVCVGGAACTNGTCGCAKLDDDGNPLKDSEGNVLPCGCTHYFTELNTSMNLEVYKYTNSSYEDMSVSTSITFSMPNLTNRTEQFEIRYDVDGNEILPGQAGYDTASIICDASKKCYQGIVDKGSGNNIYFIYTLPKYANEYSK